MAARLATWWQSPQLWRWGLGAVVGALFFGLYAGYIPNPQTRALARLSWAVIRLCEQHETTEAGRAACRRRIEP